MATSSRLLRGRQSLHDDPPSLQRKAPAFRDGHGRALRQCLVTDRDSRLKHDLIDASPGTEGLPKGHPRRLSTVLDELAANARDSVTMEEVRLALGDRSLAALLAFFAAINLLPLPPGTTLFLGPPLMIISAQMVLGHGRVWLPRRILDRSIGAAQFRSMMDKLMPRLAWLEKLIKPRLWPFASNETADRVLGVVAFILGTVVTLPIPFGNWMPAFAIFLISLAISERDGILLIAGLVAAAVAFAIIALLFGTAHALFGVLFG